MTRKLFSLCLRDKLVFRERSRTDPFVTTIQGTAQMQMIAGNSWVRTLRTNACRRRKRGLKRTNPVRTIGLEGRLTCQRVSRLLPCDLDIHPSHRLLTLMNDCVCDGAVWNAFRLIERHGFFAVTLYLCCGITLLVVILALLCSITYESTGRGIRRCGS